MCILARAAAKGLARVQAAVVARGDTLKVYDCYRPQRAVDDFVRWARRLREDRMNREFYPRVEKSGFTNYENEWWHYTLDDEPFPDTYFTFPVARRALR